MNITFRMNGVGNAFLRELGCECQQCSIEKPRANTSASLIVHEDNKILFHALFDCGTGTVDSLIKNNLNKVDCIFNTHNHLDHISDLDRLLNSLRRRNKENFIKIPFYCTKGTWDSGISSIYPWLESLVIHKNINKELLICSSIEPFQNNDLKLKVTPIPVYHGKFAIEPVIFVIEFCTNKAYKIILCWDFLNLVKSYLNKDNYDNKFNSENPDVKIDPENILFNDKHILIGADELFLAGNTISNEPSTGHASIKAGFELIKTIKPKQTWIVHYSGHEDKDENRALSDKQLQDWINNSKVQYGLGAEHPVVVAEHGMELEL